MPALIEQKPHQTVGDIAAGSSAAALILTAFNLDLCDDDAVLLETAAHGAGADLATLKQALHDLADPNSEGPAPQSTHDLIGYIVRRYHEAHRRELPELVKLARKVETIHAAHPEVPRGLADLLQKLLGEIEVHMKKEELILFPAMRRHPNGALDTPIAQMRHDHDDHQEQIKELEVKTRSFTVPDGACRSWQALYAGLAKFQLDFTAHMHLENDALFPRFEQVAKNSSSGDAPALSPAGIAEPAISTAAAEASAIEARNAAVSTTDDPWSGASLVPMLIGGMVLIILAMCAAVALA
jgi:regulator of cell morphogenesis and NO signaling